MVTDTEVDQLRYKIMGDLAWIAQDAEWMMSYVRNLPQDADVVRLREYADHVRTSHRELMAANDCRYAKE